MTRDSEPNAGTPPPPQQVLQLVNTVVPVWRDGDRILVSVVYRVTVTDGLGYAGDVVRYAVVGEARRRVVLSELERNVAWFQACAVVARRFAREAR